MKRSTLGLALGTAALVLAAPASAKEPQGQPARQLRVTPYIEANQVLTAELSPNSDTVTYTQVAAGADVSLQGRNNGVAASVRVERTFGYDNGFADSTSVSGLVRGYASVVPHALSIEGGALATRTQVDSTGGATIGTGRRGPNESRVYSAYAGPNLHTRAGDAEINANYRIGYTRAEAPDSLPVGPGGAAVDVFDDSLVQSANVHAGTRAGDATLQPCLRQAFSTPDIKPTKTGAANPPAPFAPLSAYLAAPVAMSRPSSLGWAQAKNRSLLPCSRQMSVSSSAT